MPTYSVVCDYKTSIFAVNMKLTLLLALVLIGLAAGDGAWKENHEYKYKLVSKIFRESPGSNQLNGAISRVRLTIRPQSENVLAGELTQAGFMEVTQQVSDEKYSNTGEEKQTFNDTPVDKQFEIHIKNGVIDTLSVDRTMSISQINLLKVFVSQFQVDTKAENVIESESNHLPDVTTNNAYYMTMEKTVTGECETTYDISRLPEYLANAIRESIPLPELAGQGDIIQIIKNNNYINCKDRTRYLLDLASQKKDANQSGSDDDHNASLNSRILVTGTLNNYTIQSSVTTNKVADLSEYIYLTLESVKQRKQLNTSSNYNNNPVLSLENIGDLVFTVGSDKNDLNDTENRMRLMSRQYSDSDSDPEERWSGCWTKFPKPSEICNAAFNSEWEAVGSECCGFLCLGKRARCRHSYPGCESTACWTVFFPYDTLCEKSYGNRLRVKKGLIGGCALGFWRARCCPTLYE